MSRSKIIPKKAYKLQVYKMVELDDGTSLQRVSFDLCICEKHTEVLRLMRTIENLNDNVHVNIHSVTNPRYIDSNDESLINTIY